MVLRVILELFKTGPALDGLLEDLPEIMGVVATMAEEDGKFVNGFNAMNYLVCTLQQKIQHVYCKYIFVYIEPMLTAFYK